MSSIAYNNAVSYSDALTALNTLVNDTDNFTFTSDLKNDALNTAWLDTWVVKQIWDSSITFTPGTWQYAVPSALTTVTGIYIERDNAQYPEPLDNTMYEVIEGNIQFNALSRLIIDDTYTLFCLGFYKLKTSDTLDTPELQNYVINLAAQKLLAKFGYMKVFRFLQNDTSLADIMNLRKQVDNDVAIYRQALLRTFQGI